MSRFWNANVHTLQPYIPGEQPKIDHLTKLNTNESPYGPSPHTLTAIRDAATDILRLYPDPTSFMLRQAIAEQFHVNTKQVFVGNGSDEVLAHTFRALFHTDEPVLFSDVTYGFYPIYCQMFGIPHQTIPLRDDFSIQQNDYTHPCGGIILANPNANTGMTLSLDEIETLLKRHPDRTVVIDEAYVDFGGQTAIPLIQRYDNLLVVRTFSKSSGLAGLRVGYAIGSCELIEGLTRVKDSFNSYPLSRPAQAGAEAAIRDNEWLQKTTKKIIQTRDALTNALQQRHFIVLPSKANFILAQHPQYDAGTLASALRDHAILVRHQKSSPRISNWLRITIGTDQHNEALLSALKHIEKNNLC